MMCYSLCSCTAYIKRTNQYDPSHIICIFCQFARLFYLTRRYAPRPADWPTMQTAQSALIYRNRRQLKEAWNFQLEVECGCCKSDRFGQGD